MIKAGWNELEPGALLFSFKSEMGNVSDIQAEDRPYADTNFFKNSVSDWRIEKPIFKADFCIDCQFCWIYCPDISIISRDKKMQGIDYVHCKGCGICVDVCPTNPKSLLMFSEQTKEEDALANWPTKEEKKDK